MDHEKNGPGDFKRRSSGCLIDRMEGRWYVWGKLNNYDTLIHSEGWGGGRCGGLVQFGDVWVTGGAGQAETRPRASKNKKFRAPNTLQKSLLTLMWHGITCTQGLAIEIFHFWQPQMSNSSHFALKGTSWQWKPKYLRWYTMLKRCWLGFLLIEVFHLEPSSHL